MLTLHYPMLTIVTLYYWMLTIVNLDYALMAGVGPRPDLHLRSRDQYVAPVRLTVYYRMLTLYHRMLTLYYRLLTIVTIYYQGLDLDLTYICDRVIGMSMPCVSDAVYRNDIKEVSSRYTPHPTPYTLHPTPYTLHPTPYT